MRFALMIEPQQGLSYEDQLAIARLAERLGFEALFRSDHYASFPGEADLPTTDAWAVLAGLARETSTIRLGSLVSPVTFRHPGAFVKLVTTVDAMSGGRVEVGVGAGWNDDDHGPLGLAFPPIGDRADLLEDELALFHGLWTADDGWRFDGRQVTVSGSRFRPRPGDAPGRPREHGRPRPRIITGGDGSPRSLRIAARWADEYNISSSGPERVAERMASLDEACRSVGRDPTSLTRSAMVGVLVAANEEALRQRRDAVLGAVAPGSSDAAAWLEERRQRWIVGTPDEARAMVSRFAMAGVERLMLQDFLPRDHAMIELLAGELLGRV